MRRFPPPKLLLAAIVLCIGASTPYAYYCIYPNTAVNIFRQFLNESHFQSTGEYLSVSKFSSQWSFLLSGPTFIGALVGTPIMPLIVDRAGRKGAVMVSFVPLITGALVQMLCFYVLKYELFGFGQFLIGMSMSIGGGAAAIYLSECAPVEFRGFIGTCQEITLDILYGLGMTIGLPYVAGQYQYRYMLVGLPLIVITSITVFVIFIPESPKHLLIAKHNQDAARNAVKFFNGPTFKTDDFINEVIEEQSLTTAVSYKERLRELCHKYKLHLSLSLVSVLVVPFSGIVAISLFSTEFFLLANFPESIAEYTSLGLGILNFVVTILTLPLIERAGRRPMLLCSCAGVLVFLLIFVIVSQIFKAYKYTWASYVASASILGHMIAFNMGAAPISLFYTSEVMPYAQRSIANAIVSCANLICITITSATLLPFYNYVGSYSFLVLFALPMAAMLVFLCLKMPETKQKSIAQIVLELDEMTKKHVKDIKTNI